ncbi:hypothetical protein DERF_013047 [Dermatophagoides farinae]|uniref:Uncharacterized protein n=1 Tax=Dermatophagoides farinae TaxID=6954 RepID=A0A922HKW4_DERFA|nr:hypothetical protein DERF_013047 [Dermatophagoides farinae]
MFKHLFITLFCIYLVSAAPTPEDEKPDPYSFAYDETDEYGTRLARQETADERGVVQGTYTYSDANGLTRTVQYIADDDGFRANIVSNEPGLTNSAPAAANYQIQ